jgi:hypothetical protein
MKKNYLTILVFLIAIYSLSAQENNLMPDNALAEIKAEKFKDILLNNKDVEIYLTEYVNEAEKRGIMIIPYLQTINFIFIEPESNIPRQLTEFNLGKVDFDRKLILLSSVCLIDNTILKATLFRELSHYFGVPYKDEGVEIMSLKKPEGYSYAWLSYCRDNDIKQVEYDWLFDNLKQYIN